MRPRLHLAVAATCLMVPTTAVMFVGILAFNSLKLADWWVAPICLYRSQPPATRLMMLSDHTHRCRLSRREGEAPAEPESVRLTTYAGGQKQAKSCVNPTFSHRRVAGGPRFTNQKTDTRVAKMPRKTTQRNARENQGRQEARARRMCFSFRAWSLPHPVAKSITNFCLAQTSVHVSDVFHPLCIRQSTFVNSSLRKLAQFCP
jgi:hypothetical protein